MLTSLSCVAYWSWNHHIASFVSRSFVAGGGLAVTGEETRGVCATKMSRTIDMRWIGMSRLSFGIACPRKTAVVLRRYGQIVT